MRLNSVVRLGSCIVLTTFMAIWTASWAFGQTGGTQSIVVVILSGAATQAQRSKTTNAKPAAATAGLAFKTLYNFCPLFNCPDGSSPRASLIQAANGDLYGTTAEGGSDGSGTVFKITPSGALTMLYGFCSQSGCTDGASPAAGLVQVANRDLYGTTFTGGGSQREAGTVFKITPSGTLTTVYRFCSQSGCRDGKGPAAGLVQAANGDLYGTTAYGGTSSYGTVFKITPSGTLTTLYSFCSLSNCTDGEEPLADLVQATDGHFFYGITGYGGANGTGTVFKITPSGTLTTLHTFCSLSNCADGEYPSGGLVQATDGDLYGTTLDGGANDDGTVFKITPSGALTTVYSFCSQSGCTDGAFPAAGLIQATNGDLYGTTLNGGANDDGTVFRITPSGTLTTLYTFCSLSNCTDGEEPVGDLVQDTNGAFYGTTSVGGAYGEGTIFRLSVGLGPFVVTEPTSGKVGAPVSILGTNLSGAARVAFNGMPATFTVRSASLITTTVPSGATTGKVTVVTPKGTLLSNAVFRVLP